MIERTAILGDVHGCYDELCELLILLDYKSPHVRIIMLSDLIDRGPDSVGVVRKCRELKLESVTGNHEDKFLKWLRNKNPNDKAPDRRPHYSQFSDADVDYISKMAPYIRIPEQNTIVVHAGLRNGIPLEDQSKDDLYYIRYMDSNRRFVSLKKINKAGSKEAVGAHFWTEFWKGSESIVYGHNVHDYNDPLIEETSPGVFCYGLDTGAVFGGRLTAMILETKEIVQVQAKRVYYQSNFEVR